MRSRMEWTRKTRVYLLVALACASGFVATSQRASAELRKFAVMLAHSPKAHLDNNDRPGLPDGGLTSVAQIQTAYFDRTNAAVDSFAEYWEEISYGDVIITGSTFEWVSLPWAFEPNAPDGGNRTSPADYIDLYANRAEGCTVGINPPVPAPFAYGAGEEFCDCVSSFDEKTSPITQGKCGALIILDYTGTQGVETAPQPTPTRGLGLDDVPGSGVAVWTPGERFVDLDGDERWDGLDEQNDQMCRGSDGCLGKNLCSRTRETCRTNTDCHLPGETCMLGTPGDLGHGPRGCGTPGCGDLEMPCVDWNDDDACTNFEGCVFGEVDNADPSTGMRRCVLDSECTAPPGYNADLDGDLCIHNFCIPKNCRPPDLDAPPQCCTGDPSDPDDCFPQGQEQQPGVNCVSDLFPLRVCCEFDDSTNGDRQASMVEPFEDYMVRWNSAASSFENAWIVVTEKYIRDNYPGDVEALIARTGNGIYDPPDLFINRGSTKMMQDASVNQFGWRTPKPGARYPSGAPNFETDWFATFWASRYGTTPPSWPGGTSATVGRNSPIMRPFDPEEPVPPVIRNPEPNDVRRWFRATAGGANGKGRGSGPGERERETPFDVGGDDFDFEVLPDEVFGYYDGWVEHDDLASSKYHHAGDKRLGEVTSPTTDTVTYPGSSGETYSAIAGADLGNNNPNAPQPGGGDTFNVAAGPLAINIHGEKGFDAGDVMILEHMTWRTNGLNRTPGNAWEQENGPYHPFAGPSSPRTVCVSGSRDGLPCGSARPCPGGTCRPSPIGFADYNLDGMVDQGEVRPELSENYSVDSNPFTPNNGTDSDYPFNRRRLVEDVVEALDPSIDWDDFVDPGHVGNRPNPANTVSGIVLVPSNAYTDINRFPIAPSFYPIHTEDTSFDPLFHDLVICQNCREFPAAIGYAAHEYLHTWEGYPDLYDYDVFDAAGPVNCPIGRWDIMAGSRGSAGLVHPVPPLKDELSDWVKAVDLKTVLTPGVETTLTLPPAELVPNDSYYFLENAERPGEAYYFWSAGSGFDEGRFPGKGLLILKTEDFSQIANPEALALQQRTTPANFRIVQADGLGQLEACSSTGNAGDFGDMWPGSSNTTTFNFDTIPSATWTAQDRWTGLSVTGVEPDNAGSVRLTLSWTPTNISSLRFINPPGGESVAGIYPVRFETTDVFGGTTIQLYYTKNPNDLTILVGGANRIGQRIKGAPGTIRTNMNWNVTGVPDGRYYVFAKLLPGAGADGVEREWTDPRGSRNNVGTGTLEVLDVDVSSAADATARSESWSITCIDTAGTEWVVYSSLTQPEPEQAIPGPFAHAFTCPAGSANCSAQQYTSLGGEVTFVIHGGGSAFTEGDSFHFTTTGITAPSAAVAILEGRIRISPTAVVTAEPLTVRPNEAVVFDASGSFDPQSLPLAFRWDFGDGATGAGEQTTHSYSQPGLKTVTLKATNTEGRFGEAKIDVIVLNNKPRAAFTVAPSSGSAPLKVILSAAGSSDTETPAQRLIFQWDFGDGKTENDQAAAGAQFQTIEHTFQRMADDPPGTPGRLCTPASQCTFTIKLTVTDEGGQTDSTTRSILVGNTVPLAVVTASPLDGNAPLTVTFNAIGSSDGDPGDTLTVDWDFDDGVTANAVPITGAAGATDGSVKHEYTQQGVYTPTAVVKDGRGGEAKWEGVDIHVEPPLPPNDPPTAVFTVDPATLQGLPDQVFAFDASGSSDPQSSKEDLIFRWAFGDGLFGSGVTVSHAYNRVGEFQVELTVTDDRNESDSATKTISVIPPINRPPTAIIATGPRAGTAPALLTFDGRNSFDLDRDPLTYKWEFREGSILLETLAGAVVSRVFPAPGSYGVILEVDDGRGGISRTEPVVVTVSASATPPDGGGDNEPPRGIPDSADQRPTPTAFCGLGMVSGLLGSIIGLCLMAVTRDRRRR